MSSVKPLVQTTLLNITTVDFQVVNAISIVAIFIIIAIVEKSITLPIILVAVIELAIFINLGIPHLWASRSRSSHLSV